MEEWLQENNGFAKDDVDIPSISRRDLVIIIAVGIISASLGLFLANPVSPIFELAPLLNSVYIYCVYDVRYRSVFVCDGGSSL